MLTSNLNLFRIQVYRRVSNPYISVGLAEQRQTEEANQWIVKIPMGSDKTTLSGQIQYQARIKLTEQFYFQVSGFHIKVSVCQNKDNSEEANQSNKFQMDQPCLYVDQIQYKRCNQWPEIRLQCIEIVHDPLKD